VVDISCTKEEKEKDLPIGGGVYRFVLLWTKGELERSLRRRKGEEGGDGSRQLEWRS
jgi:hypothetical protein